MASIKFPQEMPDAQSVVGNDKIMMADAVTSNAKSVSFDEVKEYLTISNVYLDPIASGALPTPPSGQTRMMNIVGGASGATWTHSTLPGGSVSLLPYQIAVLYWNGSNWRLRNVQNLPTVPVKNESGNSPFDAISQAYATNLSNTKEDVSNKSDVIDDSIFKYPNNRAVQDYVLNTVQGASFGGVVSPGFDFNDTVNGTWYFAKSGTYDIPTLGTVELTADLNIITLSSNGSWSYEPLDVNIVLDFLVCDTMIDLRNLTTIELQMLTNGAVKGVQLLGYRIKGDKPPLLYYWSNTRQVDDGGYIINPNNSTDGSLIAVVEEITNAKHFGLSESLDNQQFLTNAVQNVNVKNLFIPRGTYILEKRLSLKSNFRIFGEKGSLIKLKDGTNGSEGMPDMYVYRYIFSLVDLDNVLIEQLEFDGNRHNIVYSQAIINLTGASKKVTIQDCIFHRANYDSIYMGYYVDEILVTRNRSYDVGRTHYVIVGGSNIIVSNNYGKNSQNSCVDLETDLPGQYIRNVLVEGNIFESDPLIDNSSGFGCSGRGEQKNIVFRNNIVHVKKRLGDFSATTPSNSIIVDGNIWAGSISSYFAIDAYDGGGDIIIVNNILNNLEVEEVTGGMIRTRGFKTAIIKNNVCNNSSGDGIWVDNFFGQGKLSCLIEGNKINNTKRTAVNSIITLNEGSMSVDITVSNNYVHGAIDGITSDSTRTSIVSNKVYNCTGNAVNIQSTFFIITDNQIFNNNIGINNTSANSVICNNIVRNNNSGITFGASSTGHVISGNLFANVGNFSSVPALYKPTVSNVFGTDMGDFNIVTTGTAPDFNA